MNIRHNPVHRMLLAIALLGLIPITGWAATANVTFTVPVQISNIHSDWNKVAVMCHGFVRASGHSNDPTRALKVGEIDVSGLAGKSVSQTVTGTIPVISTADAWECFLFIQHQGESAPVYPRNRAELKTTTGTVASGTF